MKLSKIQERALNKLTENFLSAYSLQESISTLDSLVKKGLAIKEVGLGSLFCPRTSLKYKRIYKYKG